MKNNFCGCISVRSSREALGDMFSRELVDGKVRGEFYELLAVRSWAEFRDEMSDMSYGFGRLLGGLVGKPYVHVPGDALHLAKMDARMAEYGCVRSTRFLVDGCCPNG